MIKHNHSPLWGKPPSGLISGIVPCMFDKLDSEKHCESKGGSAPVDISICLFIYFPSDGMQDSRRLEGWRVVHCGMGILFSLIWVLLRGVEHWAFTLLSPSWVVSVQVWSYFPLKAVLRALRFYTVSHWLTLRPTIHRVWIKHEAVP